MKLTAMRDHHSRSQDQRLKDDKRDEAAGQSVKHARDVCRALAMMTEAENAVVSDMVEHLRETPAFQNGKAIHKEFFKDDTGRGCTFTRNQWTPEGFRLIRQILSDIYN